MVGTLQDAHRAKWSRNYDALVASLYIENNNPAEIARHLEASSLNGIWSWPETHAHLLWRVYQHSKTTPGFSRVCGACEAQFRRWAPATSNLVRQPWQKLGRELVIQQLIKHTAPKQCCGMGISEVEIKTNGFGAYTLTCPVCRSVVLNREGPRF